MIKQKIFENKVFDTINKLDKNKELVLENYGGKPIHRKLSLTLVFKAFVFQKLVFPELKAKKAFLEKFDIDIDILIKNMTDENFFIDIQRRFGARLADPTELRNKNMLSKVPKDFNLPDADKRSRFSDFPIF